MGADPKNSEPEPRKAPNQADERRRTMVRLLAKAYIRKTQQMSKLKISNENSDE